MWQALTELFGDQTHELEMGGQRGGEESPHTRADMTKTFIKVREKGPAHKGLHQAEQTLSLRADAQRSRVDQKTMYGFTL